MQYRLPHHTPVPDVKRVRVCVRTVAMSDRSFASALLAAFNVARSGLRLVVRVGRGCPRRSRCACARGAARSEARAASVDVHGGALLRCRLGRRRALTQRDAELLRGRRCELQRRRQRRGGRRVRRAADACVPPALLTRPRAARRSGEQRRPRRCASLLRRAACPALTVLSRRLRLRVACRPSPSSSPLSTARPPF